MTELSHRNQPVVSRSSAVERVAVVRPVTPTAQATTRADASEASRAQLSVPDTAGAFAQSGEEPARTFADYARVNRDIASVVDNLDTWPAKGNAASVAQAESAILSLLPAPSVVLPLPPASADMVQFVAQVAQSIQRQAAQTRAALSGVAPVTVDAAIAA
ncbi:MAG TPA: hypothetical protein VF503_27800 [Sphingobium sp.]|uniref:hypothetical protein n=1 Tax=Sphingobium sp. TaxID=1912891 RepID=UPI002ECFF844